MAMVVIGFSFQRKVVILVLQVPTFSSANYAQEPASYTLLCCFMLPMCNLCKVGENETTF